MSHMRQCLSLMALLIFCASVFAQTKTTKGRITDQQGQPVPFATVRIKGSNKGVSADADGNFTIKADMGATLVVTGTGLTATEVAVNTDGLLTVTVNRKNSNLTEVVVTALGIRRSRNSLPYAAQQIQGGEVDKMPSTNFVSNLSGKVSGLTITQSNAVGGSTNAILRGFKSLTQTNQALFVVDGIPYDNTNQSRNGYDLGNAASDINPDDIESVSVLKGAGASALYGSRGANGVILITTKKGHRQKGLGVSASFGVTVGTPDKSTLPTYQTMYGEGYGSASAGSSLESPATGSAADGFFYYGKALGDPTQTTHLIAQTNFDAATGPAYDPSLQVFNWDAFAPGDPNYGKTTAWKPAAHHNPTDFFVTPVTTNTNIMVDGGSDKGTFKIAYSRADNKDYMPNSSNTKNLLDMNATYNINDKVSVFGTLNYSDNSGIGRYLYSYTGTTSPMTDFRQWWPTNVDIKAQKADYFRNTAINNTWNWQPNAYGVNAGNLVQAPAYHDNLYWDRYQNFETDSRTRYLGFAGLNYKITPYLNFMGRVSMDYYDQSYERKNNVGSQTVSFYEKYLETYHETNYDLLLNFDKNLTSDLNLKALLGTNVRQDYLSSTDASTSGGLVVPGLYALSNSFKTAPAPTEVLDRKEVDGIFAGATLGWRELITLDGTIRRDKSSTLPDNNNTYYYPSVSANFIFSKLLSQMSWLSYGKVWANYAEVGNDADFYQTSTTFLAGTSFSGVPNYGFQSQHNNPDLKPERNKAYEGGLEASFLNSRLGFTAVYYHSKQINQITPISVSTATGYNTYVVNAGAVQNSGVELSVNLTPVKTRDFSWTMTVNWTDPKNKVLALYNGQPSLAIAKLQNSIQLVGEVGKPYGIIRGTDYVYANGKRVITDDGYYKLASNSLSDIGSIQPKWYGGINNTVTYKNWALGFLVDVKKGGQLYSLDMDYGSSSGLYPRTAGYNDKGQPVRAPLSQGGGIVLKGVLSDGKTPNTTRIDESDINTGNYTFSSAYGEADKEFVYDAGYVKLREVTLNYTFPQSFVDKQKVFKGIDVSLAGRNLWIIHKNVPYADPEQGQASGNASIGFQNGAYPTMRTFAAIVKFKF